MAPRCQGKGQGRVQRREAGRAVALMPWSFVPWLWAAQSEVAGSYGKLDAVQVSLLSEPEGRPPLIFVFLGAPLLFSYN